MLVHPRRPDTQARPRHRLPLHLAHHLSVRAARRSRVPQRTRPDELRRRVQHRARLPPQRAAQLDPPVRRAGAGSTWSTTGPSTSCSKWRTASSATRWRRPRRASSTRSSTTPTRCGRTRVRRSGSGPYQLVTTADDHLVFDRFTDYKGGLTGEIDAAIELSFVADSAAAERRWPTGRRHPVWRSLVAGRRQRVAARREPPGAGGRLHARRAGQQPGPATRLQPCLSVAR